MEKIDTVVIGAGVVGLAIAREISTAGKEVIVVDKEAYVGNHTSSRNSEVIHAGLYYPTNSLKAKHCLRGKIKIYEYCMAKGIQHEMIGKFVIATNEKEAALLKKIKDQAVANGVLDLQLLCREEVHEYYPDLTCYQALYSPSTGIIDSHELMTSFQVDIEKNAGHVVLNTFLRSIKPIDKGFVLQFGGSDEYEIIAKNVVNSAGLWATELARNIEGVRQNTIPETKYVKGNYCSYNTTHPFKHLIYPVPVPGGLGTHLTINTGGQLKIGPDVQWGTQEVDYSINNIDLDKFHESVMRYWPSVKREKMAPDYCGLRPKIFKGNTLINDFVISTEQDHGTKNLVNLYGIESPGLTACMSIAEEVSRVIKCIGLKRI